jgi:hypothetical protein
MTNITHDPTLYAVLALLSLCCLGSLATKKAFLIRLHKVRPELWEQLGEPGVFSVGIFSSLSLLSFVWSGKYQSIFDEKVLRLGRRLRILSLSYVASFVLLVLLIVSRL